jgi:Xaa-Pro aminopeptidase/Xaa-Pro dipeptidase
MEEGFQEAQAGQTERALLDSILNKVNAYGGYDIRSATLASGEQTRHAYPVAGERVLEQGDLIRADVEGVFQGYGSHVARMAIVGAASEAQKDTYRRYREIQRALIADVRAAVRACDVHERCVQGFARLGIEYTWPYVGHGFGLAGQERPILEPHNTDELLPGMLVSIEPACFDTPVGGYRLGDLVLIGDDGAEILTTFMDTEQMFVIQ